MVWYPSFYTEDNTQGVKIGLDGASSHLALILKEAEVRWLDLEDTGVNESTMRDIFTAALPSLEALGLTEGTESLPVLSTFVLSVLFPLSDLL
jgi:hypothetical protein